MGNALGLVAPVDHDLASQGNGLGIGGVQEKHRCRGARVEALLAHAAKEVSHIHGDLTKVDVHRTRCEALMADGAVIGDIGELLPMLDGDAPAGLLLVEEGLDQKRCGQNFVARRIEQIGPWRVGGTDWFALAATQAVGEGIGNGANVALLHDQALGPHESKRRRVGPAKVCAF